MSVQMMMVRDAGAPVFFRRPLIALPRAHAVGFAIAPPPPPPPPCIQFHLPIPHFSHPAPISDKVEVRRVCRYNLKMELAIIEGMVRRGYRFASFDTEFPGTVVPSGIDRRFLSQAGPDEVYRMMRDNVNQTHIIQLGFTISDPNGRLPVVNGAYCCWEFNFRDFDVDSDSHLRNNDSIELLKRQGIDFDENKRSGISSCDFALETRRSRLIELLPCLTWVTFHCSYDFGYLIRILSGEALPDGIEEFMGLVRKYCGPSVYDLKFMIRFCPGLFGGLERVANTLDVGRVAGSSHQAGSDSLLTLQTFFKLLSSEKDKHNHELYEKLRDECRGILYALGSLQYH
ncbi:probable CCR4-associated factor 1 homolog 11 isoform X1 [Argentina anserina]|uniref:probable CCR4-associated factor 1 homolog 11 isoform X1 n=1 Tax=Argentina anserina TaxID=57926 RepID=UPI0021766A81|nr:probable CCR4-associated factor 1 homolog 11 isoform X1 [Potentilla anserina]